MRKSALILTMIAAAGVCACSSPPKPEVPTGDYIAANNEATLTELVRIARQGKPKTLRFLAEKGDTLLSVFDTWTQQSDMRLQWQTTTRFKVKADIDAPDLKSAILAIATQLKDESPSLLVEFPNESTLSVREFGK